MLTKANINSLLAYRARAEIYNQMLRGLVAFTTKIVGDEDLAHNFVYELWDLDRLLAEMQGGSAALAEIREEAEIRESD